MVHRAVAPAPIVVVVVATVGVAERPPEARPTSKVGAAGREHELSTRGISWPNGVTAGLD